MAPPLDEMQQPVQSCCEVGVCEHDFCYHHHHRRLVPMYMQIKTSCVLSTRLLTWEAMYAVL